MLSAGHTHMVDESVGQYIIVRGQLSKRQALPLRRRRGLGQWHGAGRAPETKPSWLRKGELPARRSNTA